MISSIILSIPIIVSFTLAVQLALRSSKEIPFWILSITLILNSISYLYFNLFVVDKSNHISSFLSNDISILGVIFISCLIYPMICYFFVRIFQVETIQRKKIGVLFLFALSYPLVALMIKGIKTILTMMNSELSFYASQLYQWMISQGVYFFLSILITFTTFYIIKVFKNYQIQLKNFFSNIEDKSIREGQILFISIITFSLIKLTYNFFWYHDIIFSENNINWVHILRTILLFIVGNSALQIQFTASSFRAMLEKSTPSNLKEITIPEPEPYKETIIKKNNGSTKVHELLKEQFEKLMNEEEIYLRKGLTIEQVADMLKTNRTYLSHMINHYYQNSFNTVINEHRVQHAISLYEKTRGDYTIEWIARESGFSSPSVFCRTFRTIKGHNASSYFKNHHRMENK